MNVVKEEKRNRRNEGRYIRLERAESRDCGNERSILPLPQQRRTPFYSCVFTIHTHFLDCPASPQTRMSIMAIMVQYSSTVLCCMLSRRSGTSIAYGALLTPVARLIWPKSGSSSFSSLVSLCCAVIESNLVWGTQQFVRFHVAETRKKMRRKGRDPR